MRAKQPEDIMCRLVETILIEKNTCTSTDCKRSSVRQCVFLRCPRYIPLTHSCIRTHARTHARTHTRTHARTHTHTHTHTHNCTLNQLIHELDMIYNSKFRPYNSICLWLTEQNIYCSSIAYQGHSESSTRLESFKSRIEWMSGIMVSLNSFPSQSLLIKITQLQLFDACNCARLVDHPSQPCLVLADKLPHRITRLKESTLSGW